MVNYDAFAETFSNSRKNHPWPEVDFFLSEMQKSGVKSILDIGCGNGRFIEQAEKQGFSLGTYLGIDSSLGMIEEARKLHGEYRFEVRNMSELGKWGDSEMIGKYDAILFLASFHHLETREERLQVLRDIKPYLEPHGQISMTNWNLLEQERYTKSHRGNGDFDIKIGEYTRYYHGFTTLELETLFRESGYRILENRAFEGGRNIVSIISI
ncbi:class I SAM-dependent methyltransferase [Candidatus Gracilibacteria bacterium]|nr:class I SAM-dependent methyltransferase [Candidatus Gracilibacteria bacterium]